MDQGKIDGSGTRIIRASSANMNSAPNIARRASAEIPRLRRRSASVPSSNAPRLIPMAIVKSWLITPCRSKPSTSANQDAAHNEGIAQDDPMQVAERGAILRKRGSEKMGRSVSGLPDGAERLEPS